MRLRRRSAGLGQTRLVQKVMCPRHRSHSHSRSTLSGLAGAHVSVEDGDPPTHTHTHRHAHVALRHSPPSARLQPTGLPRSQKHYRPYQPLFYDRVGLGPGEFILRLRQKVQSVGGKQTGPQSDNKLGGKFSGCYQAGGRTGCQVGPPRATASCPAQLSQARLVPGQAHLTQALS